MKKHLIALLSIIGIILAVGSVLIATESLPEHRARDFNPLSELSIKSGMKAVKVPGFDGISMYAVSDAAEQALYIAMGNGNVKGIVNSLKGKDVTVAAVQPTDMVSTDGSTIHGTVGQIRIAANWQIVDASPYSVARDFSELDGKTGESHQQIWNVMVDMDRKTVTDIFEENERVMNQTIHASTTYMDVNMFMPYIVRVKAGSTVEWENISFMPHNIVGTYKTFGSEITVDSGSVEYRGSWLYTFNEEGVFEYHCAFHSDDGMKGTIIVYGNA
jgi:plastocyanin